MCWGRCPRTASSPCTSARRRRAAPSSPGSCSTEPARHLAVARIARKRPFCRAQSVFAGSVRARTAVFSADEGVPMQPYGVILDGPAPDGTVFRHGVFNEVAVRAAAGITMALGTYAFVYANFAKYFLPIKLVTAFFFVDFLLRVTVGLQWSPVGVVSRWIVRNREPQWVSAKPKRFAWTLGLIMSAGMTVITNVN